MGTRNSYFGVGFMVVISGLGVGLRRGSQDEGRGDSRPKPKRTLLDSFRAKGESVTLDLPSLLSFLFDFILVLCSHSSDPSHLLRILVTDLGLSYSSSH